MKKVLSALFMMLMLAFGQSALAKMFRLSQ